MTEANALTAGRWRLMAIGCTVALGLAAYGLRPLMGERAAAAAGAACLIGVVACFSSDLRRVNWRTVGFGIGFQVALALFILKVEIGGRRPGFELFRAIGAGVQQFLQFTNRGSEFVFGNLARGGETFGFVFAFTALPTIIFVSAFFMVLYHFGIVQWVVRVVAKSMVPLMQTSGAETLSAAGNIFMGQTEAPILVRPYIDQMTSSELLALMVGGFATISAGLMAVYIDLGADPVAILTTSVMAAPCGLYLSKILLPETGEPVTRGEVKLDVRRTHANVFDAAAAGASDGTRLAINVAAMLIAFLAFIAMIDFLLGLVSSSWSLVGLFSIAFAPLAVLMGVPQPDVARMADLLGTKLVANEFVAFVKLTTEYKPMLSPKAFTLATYALAGFANFGSVGIQLGGIGGMAPSRRADLARLGSRALLAGFVATLVNAAIASILL